MQLQPGQSPIRQKTKTIPYLLQSYVEKQINKITQSGHLEKKEKVEENCFVSLLVLTLKDDKSVKLALGSRNSNDSFINKRQQMRKMNNLRHQLSTTKTRLQNEPIWVMMIDLG